MRDDVQPEPELMNCEAAARLLGVTHYRVWYLAAGGDIKAARDTFGRLMLRAETVRAFAKGKTRNPDRPRRRVAAS